jgi:adenylosuccinate synthase
MINGVTQLLMMKADVLSIFPEIKICTQYKLSDGSVTDQVPYEQINENITPIYVEVKGWNCNLKGLVEEELPKELKNYIEFLEDKLEVPISLISTGPDRTETIHRFKQPA